jgi:hypothetical protein
MVYLHSLFNTAPLFEYLGGFQHKEPMLFMYGHFAFSFFYCLFKVSSSTIRLLDQDLNAKCSFVGYYQIPFLGDYSYCYSPSNVWECPQSLQQNVFNLANQVRNYLGMIWVSKIMNDVPHLFIFLKPFCTILYHSLIDIVHISFHFSTRFCPFPLKF